MSTSSPRAPTCRAWIRHGWTARYEPRTVMCKCDDCGHVSISATVHQPAPARLLGCYRTTPRPKRKARSDQGSNCGRADRSSPPGLKPSFEVSVLVSDRSDRLLSRWLENADKRKPAAQMTPRTEHVHVGSAAHVARHAGRVAVHSRAVAQRYPAQRLQGCPQLLQRVKQIGAVGVEGESEFRSVDRQLGVPAMLLRADHRAARRAGLLVPEVNMEDVHAVNLANIMWPGSSTEAGQSAQNSRPDHFGCASTAGTAMASFSWALIGPGALDRLSNNAS
jgi:hypothetical protein